MAEPAQYAPQRILDAPLPVCKGYQQLTTELAAAVGLTVPNGTTIAIIQCEVADVRYRADGVNPTATVGMLIALGGELLYVASTQQLSALRFLRTAVGAVINVSYY